MSSLARKIQRQQTPSQGHYEKVGIGEHEWVVNPPREKFYRGRGSKLGYTNPKARDLLARAAREAKRREAAK